MLAGMRWGIAALDAREVDAELSCRHHCWPDLMWTVRLLVCNNCLAMLEFMVTFDLIWNWLMRCLVGMTLRIDKFCNCQTNIAANLQCLGRHVLGARWWTCFCGCYNFELKIINLSAVAHNFLVEVLVACPLRRAARRTYWCSLESESLPPIAFRSYFSGWQVPLCVWTPLIFVRCTCSTPLVISPGALATTRSFFYVYC